MKIRLENWSFCGSRDPYYTAPEAQSYYLTGEVYNDPRGREDGKVVCTSYIVSSEGKEATTYSGTVYILGDPNPEYLTWMANNNIEFDPENPIKVKGYDE